MDVITDTDLLNTLLSKIDVLSEYAQYREELLADGKVSQEIKNLLIHSYLGSTKGYAPNDIVEAYYEEKHQLELAVRDTRQAIRRKESQEQINIFLANEQVCRNKTLYAQAVLDSYGTAFASLEKRYFKVLRSYVRKDITESYYEIVGSRYDSARTYKQYLGDKKLIESILSGSPESS